MHLGLHSLRQFAHAPLAGDLGLREECHGAIAAESGMNAGHEIDGLVDAQPRGQHCHVGDEAAFVHQLGAVAKRFAAQYGQMTFIIGEPQNGAQSAGFAGAVGTDESDDTARLDIEGGAVHRNGSAVFFRQVSSFDERSHSNSHSSVGKLPRGGGAGWERAGACANNSSEENPSRLMTARICGHSSFKKRSRSPDNSSRLAPSLTYMPRPRRFSTRFSSTSC